MVVVVVVVMVVVVVVVLEPGRGVLYVHRIRRGVGQGGKGPDGWLQRQLDRERLGPDQIESQSVGAVCVDERGSGSGSGQSDSLQEPKSCGDRSMALDRGRQTRLGACGGRDEAGRPGPCA